MLEIIKALIEIAKSLVGAPDKLRSEQFRAVGEKLLVLYFRVNETIDGAQAMLRGMERYRRDTEWRQNHGKEAIYTSTTHHFAIDQILKEQSLNIGRLGAALRQLRVELSLVDADLLRRLTGLSDGKANAVSMLSLMLRTERIPLKSIGSEELETAIKENLERRGFFDYRELISGGHGEVITERFGSEELYRQISTYLDSGLPHTRIAEFVALANEMREQIGKHWSLSEILPRATQLIGKAE
jgi:hypothetical protein